MYVSISYSFLLFTLVNWLSCVGLCWWWHVHCFLEVQRDVIKGAKGFWSGWNWRPTVVEKRSYGKVHYSEQSIVSKNTSNSQYSPYWRHQLTVITQRGWNKVTNILWTTFIELILLLKIDGFFLIIIIKNLSENCFEGSNWPAFIQIMAWCQSGNNPFSEP